MTYREWAGRPDLIAEFASLLAHPTMQAALSVCTEIGLPKTRFTPNTPNLVENHALLNSKHEGYFEFLKNLKALAVQKPVSLEEDKMAPWKYKSEIAED